MDGFVNRLIDGYTEAIADSESVHLSVNDQASITQAMTKVCQMKTSQISLSIANEDF